MKGKDTFTSAELSTIRELIIQKCNAPSQQQKSIRGKLRKNFQFYITDFADDITTVEMFDELLANGTIKCSDQSFVPNTNAKAQTNASHPKKGLSIGLAPIVGKDPHVLILGTLPGEESLKRQQYYSKSGNRFWQIIYTLFSECKVSPNYSDRVEFLKKHGIAIWDVLSGAQREGSLDANITDEQPNDLRSFLKQHPTIKTVAFNGNKAAKQFSKFFPDLTTNHSLKLLPLYSTSGANRQFSDSEMLKNWANITQTPAAN